MNELFKKGKTKILLQFSNLAAFISRQSWIKNKETLLLTLLCHKLEFTVGKIISLELVTLCCVSECAIYFD